MWVYILLLVDWEDCKHIGVYSTREKAQAKGLSLGHSGSWQKNKLEGSDCSVLGMPCYVIEKIKVDGNQASNVRELRDHAYDGPVFVCASRI